MLGFATDLLRWGWVIAEAILLILLFRRGLASRYRWFVTFLVVELTQMITLLSLDPGSAIYAKYWAASEVLLLLALGFAVVEVTKRILEHYRHVNELAASSFGMTFCFGFAAAIVLLLPFLEASSWQPTHTYLLVKVLRWESVTVFLFLAAQVLWFKLFPIKMRRNVVLHRWLLAFYGGAVPGASVFLYDLFDRDKIKRTWINLGMMGLQICLLGSWCLWFNTSGEKDEEQAADVWQSEDRQTELNSEEHLSINSTWGGPSLVNRESSNAQIDDPPAHREVSTLTNTFD